MERTLAHVAAVLTRRYDTPVSARRVRDWVHKGFLPSLSQRGRGRGQGKSYFWEQRNIVQQAAAVFELLRWRGRTDLIPLQLWLLGYKVPISRVRATLLHVIERCITAWTQGVDAADTEELADVLSRLAVKASSLRGRSGSVALRMPRAVRESAAELMFNIGFNADFQPDHTMLSELFEGMRTVDQDQDAIALEWGQRIIQFIQVHFSRVHQRDVIARAPDAVFAEVQDDFCLLCNALKPYFAHRSLWRSPLKYNVVGKLGLMAIPMLLSMREAGYAPWIDYGRAVLSQFSRPAIQDAFERRDWEALQALFEAPTVVPSIKPLDAHQTT
jgi:hypothetical protein